VLSQLGPDPAANAQLLTTSGILPLAQLGLNMEDKSVTRQREDVANAQAQSNWQAQQAIRAAQEKRAQGNYEKAQEDEDAAAKLMAGLAVPGRTAAPAAPADVFSRGAPSIAPSQLTSPADAATSPIAPSQLEATGAATLPDRIASNLVSGQPAAAAGISREQIAELYRNPITRPIATAFLQKQMDPGKWTYHVDNDTGRVIATNANDPSQTKDVTPGTAAGVPVASKQEREVQGYIKAGKALGMTDEQAAAYAANKGKTPSQDLRPTEEKMVNELADKASAGQTVIDNIETLKKLSPKSWSGMLAHERAALAQKILPDAFVPQGAINTEQLRNLTIQNVAAQAKAVFGARPAVYETKLLQELETLPEQSDAARQAIYQQLGDMMKKKVAEHTARAEAIRNKTFFKPGGGAPAAPTAGAADPLGIR
jgi:hypothetical protein